MQPIIIVYVLILTCGLSQSYPVYGGSKRYHRANMIAPVMPIYTPVSPQQYYDIQSPATNYLQPPQYMSVPYPQQSQPQRLADDYNNRNNQYLYYPRQDYQEPLYGVPTFHGDYQPKPYYFAQPSYSSDDRLETANPLDYLHEEILQENERERSRNNAAFMQNLALYNKQLDSFHNRQQQLQKIQDIYGLKSTNDYEDYDAAQPNDWYDQTSILVDPNSYSDNQIMPKASPQQYQYQTRPADYDDEMVKELKDLTKNRKNVQDYDFPTLNKGDYNNFDWPADMPQDNDDDTQDPEWDEPRDGEEDDGWINWERKRDIQPKKDYAFVDGKKPASVNKIAEKTVTPMPVNVQKTQTTIAENSKLIAKLHKGQKEFVLPRPATPVRRPFAESVEKLKETNHDNKPTKSDQTPPIYKTIKQIIDMEQNLSHVSILSIYIH